MISVQMISTSAIIIFKNFYVIIIPIIGFVAVFAWLTVWMYGFLYFLSTGDITQPTKGSQMKKVELKAGDEILVFV